VADRVEGAHHDQHVRPEGQLVLVAAQAAFQQRLRGSLLPSACVRYARASACEHIKNVPSAEQLESIVSMFLLTSGHPQTRVTPGMPTANPVAASAVHRGKAHNAAWLVADEHHVKPPSTPKRRQAGQGSVLTRAHMHTSP